MKAIRWMLFVSFALPAAVDAQQAYASSEQNQQEQVQPEAVQAKTEAAQAKTEAAQGKTEEKQTEETQAKSEKDTKVISGMSILGNQEAPKSLVIVPWKSSELGDSIGISTKLDDSRQPVDKDVFMRALHYYEIRSDNSHPESAPAPSAAPKTAAAANRRKQ